MRGDVTQDDIVWIQGAMNYHLDQIVQALMVQMNGGLVGDGSYTPGEHIRFNASAIHALLERLEKNAQFGTPIQRKEGKKGYE